jgi:peptidoglycan/LPS O-acetylase OafA/YrhL
MGTWRLILATMVVFQHLHPVLFGVIGTYAVFAFYMLSGFLITRVVNERYENGFDGLRRFSINRFLRLYPTYYLVLVLSALFVAFAPEIAFELNRALRLPQSVYGVLAQVSIFGLLMPQALVQFDPSSLYWARLVPVAWSLNMELIFYFFIAIAFGKSRLAATLWWLLGIGFFVWLFIVDNSRFTYFTLLGPSICFSSGAMIYFSGLHKRLTVTSGLVYLASTLFLLFCLAFGGNALLPKPFALSENAALLLSIPLSFFALVMILAADERSGRKTTWAKIDNYVADLSYPLFLSHWPVAVLVSAVIFRGEAAFGWPLLLVSLLASVALSVAIVELIEKPVQSLRAKLRQPRATRAG